MNQVIIRRPSQEDEGSLNAFFIGVLKDTFDKNRLYKYRESMEEEIMDKAARLKADFESGGEEQYFLVAETLSGEIIGTIGYSPANATILACDEGLFRSIPEINTVFVLPDYQGRGLVDQLLLAICSALIAKGHKSLCFDSGYPLAQKTWQKKFGPPTYYLKDYWDVDADHMVWLLTIEGVVSSLERKQEDKNR